ncbi:hypothetical protein NDA17_005072 [Ustilago hordei]|nr:hypothetical protein NDA17_005072 [Ustilago hordei]
MTPRSGVSVDDDEVDGVGDEIGDVDDNEVDGVGDKVGGVNTSVQCVDLMLEVIPGLQWTTAFGSILIRTANLLWAPSDVRYCVDSFDTAPPPHDLVSTPSTLLLCHGPGCSRSRRVTGSYGRSTGIEDLVEISREHGRSAVSMETMDSYGLTCKGGPSTATRRTKLKEQAQP